MEKKHAGNRKGKAGAGKPGSSFITQLDAYLPGAEEWDRLIEEKEGFSEDEDPASLRSRLRRMAPEAEIDLHGMTRAEAVSALDLFFQSARRDGLQKVLVIHGKGNHSGSGSVLPSLVREYLQKAPFAGETGKAHRTAGGSGATWVLLK
jgi:DNA-nicking Smr family endonuclease